MICPASSLCLTTLQSPMGIPSYYVGFPWIPGHKILIDCYFLAIGTTREELGKEKEKKEKSDGGLGEGEERKKEIEPFLFPFFSAMSSHKTMWVDHISRKDFY